MNLLKYNKNHYLSMLYAFAVGLLCGIGRNLPDEKFVYLGIAVIDFVLIISFIILAIKNSRLLKKHLFIYKNEFIIFYIFALLCSISIFINGIDKNILTKDIFEVFKYLLIPFYLTVYSIVYKNNPLMLLLSYLLGLLVIGIIALLNPMNDNVEGTIQIFNPNVIGNVLTFSVFFLFFLLVRYSVKYIFLLLLLLVIAFFTFSKAAWIMILLSLLIIYLYIMLSKAEFSQKLNINFFIFLPVCYLIFLNYELISNLIIIKINATDFNASASEGGSFSARLAFLKSSMLMFFDNPFFGVGISNWEQAHILNKKILFEDFYLDDNPNSAFFYVLSCMGIFCFLIYLIIVSKFLLYFMKFNVFNYILYTFFALLIISISGNIQLEMLTSYYFWFFYSIYKFEYYKNENRNS